MCQTALDRIRIGLMTHVSFLIESLNHLFLPSVFLMPGLDLCNLRQDPMSNCDVEKSYGMSCIGGLCWADLQVHCQERLRLLSVGLWIVRLVTLCIAHKLQQCPTLQRDFVCVTSDWNVKCKMLFWQRLPLCLQALLVLWPFKCFWNRSFDDQSIAMWTLWSILKTLQNFSNRMTIPEKWSMNSFKADKC